MGGRAWGLGASFAPVEARLDVGKALNSCGGFFPKTNSSLVARRDEVVELCGVIYSR